MEIALKYFLSTTVIGPQERVNLLFKDMGRDNNLLDRLYRKYVKYVALVETLEVLSFSLEGVVRKHNDYREIADRLTFAFNDAIDMAKAEVSKYNEYTPIRLVPAELPYRYFNVPLEDYDNLEGAPLWMRPEYMLEKYGNK